MVARNGTQDVTQLKVALYKIEIAWGKKAERKVLGRYMRIEKKGQNNNDTTANEKKKMWENGYPKIRTQEIFNFKLTQNTFAHRTASEEGKQGKLR